MQAGLCSEAKYELDLPCYYLFEDLEHEVGGIIRI